DPSTMEWIFIISLILPGLWSINLRFFPCDSEMNDTTADCNKRLISKVPFKSTELKILKLSQTKMLQVKADSFKYVSNLRTLEMMDNCLPARMRSPDKFCTMEIHYNAFKTLPKLQNLYLSGNSLTSIPWLPESLLVLDLQNNHISHISISLGTPNLRQLLLSKNCFYANPCNRSFHITEKVFGDLPKLENLTLGYNNLTEVPKGLPPTLVSLDLKENTITQVLDGTFSNLTNLTHLVLEWNCQRCDHAARPCFPCPNNLPLNLSSNSLYAEKSSIIYLSLRGNSLKTFPEGLFRPLTSLQRLDLSDNRLAFEIQNGKFFTELKNLTWISLIYNYEPLVTFSQLKLSKHISEMSRLQYLLLSGIFFHRLSNQSFNVLSSLKHLIKIELRMNFINDSNITALRKLPSLVNIVLSQNMLAFLPCIPGTTLNTTLAQNSNQYAYEVQEQPIILRKRETESGNEFPQSGPFNVFDRFEDCSPHFPSPWEFRNHLCYNNLSVDFSQNEIASLNRHVFEGMEDVVCLDLSFNYMSERLQTGEFSSMKNLAFLNLSYNRLDLYHDNVFSELNRTLKVLDVSNNDFHFKMRGMGHRFVFLKNLMNLEVLSLANNGIGMRIDQALVSSSVKYFYFYGNDLNIMWASDNTKYTHFFQNMTNLMYLDISDNNLVSISPEVLVNFPRSLKALRVSDNKLKYFPWWNISALFNLCYLDLSGNHLSHLPHEVIPFGANFTLLDLSSNYISVIPEDFLQNSKSLEYLRLDHNQIMALDRQLLPAPFKNGSALKELSLHGNPFKCDCDTSWLADFLGTTDIKVAYLTTEVYCKYPESQQGQSVLSMDQRSCQDIYGSLAFLVCSFLVVLSTVLPLLKHLYGWDMWYCLQVIWAGHKGYSQLAGTNLKDHYDAFVVFDTGNQAVRDWVYNELTVTLENRGQRTFSLCLEERDWVPGLSCIDNLHNSVNKSKKTVFVLSSTETINGVIRQAFFMVQQRLLDEKVDTAVLVLLDEKFPKLKYLQLRKKLCRKSVLTWPRNPRAQPLFWNKMRTVLSSDNLTLYDNNMSESFI
uniref:Toll-like receptor 9 n=1 Tax=Cynoglossus semilaevis TaxID=244447 RepID=A0A3P8UVH6_CYNSE